MNEAGKARYEQFKAWCRKNDVIIRYYDCTRWGTSVKLGFDLDGGIYFDSTIKIRPSYVRRYVRAHRLARRLCTEMRVHDALANDIHYIFWWREVPLERKRQGNTPPKGE